jgi:hypothetical protein
MIPIDCAPVNRRNNAAGSFRSSKHADAEKQQQGRDAKVIGKLCYSDADEDSADQSAEYIRGIIHGI